MVVTRFMLGQCLNYKKLLEQLAVDGRDVGKLLMDANSNFGWPFATEERLSYCCFQSEAEIGVSSPQNLAVDSPYLVKPHGIGNHLQD